MDDIKQYSLQADLALAAYATLSSGEPNTVNLEAIGMSSSQAIDFAKCWTVVEQYTHSELVPVLDEFGLPTGEYTNYSNGVSATVFEDVESGRRYLAVRGTELGVADLVADAILATGFSPEVNPQFVSLRTQVQRWLDSGTLRAGFSIAGHSLGGYLATATGVWFVDSGGVYMYNAPGIGGFAWGNAYDAVRSVFGLGDRPFIDNLYNFRGSEGISIITGLGLQLAPPTLIEIEAAAGGILGPGNHSVVRLVDAFAVYSLYSQHSPSLALAQITQLIKSASPIANRSLEYALDGLRTLLMGKSVVDANPTKYEGPDARDSLYKNLYALQDSAAYRALKGSAALRVLADADRDTLVAKAKSDFGDLLALHYLLPIAIEGGGSALIGAHADLHTQWQADRALTAEQKASGKANFTDEWLEDRAAMLTWKLKLATEDFVTTSGAYTSAPDQFFADLGSGLQLNLGADGTNPADKSRYIFGKDQAEGVTEVVSGGSKKDRLYGGGGDDVLYGYDSVDHLEGGTGSDQLNGGEGNDTLIGGADSDTLIGGKGNDKLIGGLGDDTYRLARGDGADIVVENDATLGNTDVAQFLAGIGADQIWLRHVGNSLEASIIGTTDKLTVQNWYLGDQYHVEQFTTADGRLLLDSQVENLVQAMAVFAPPAAGQTTLPPTYQDTLAPVIAANWQ